MNRIKPWLLLISLFLSHFISIAQSDNLLLYKAPKIQLMVVKDYISPKPIVIQDKVFGTNVIINVDTVFKKYKVAWTDENNVQKQFTFRFIRNELPKFKDDNGLFSFWYRMQLYDSEYILIDYMNWGALRSLEIRDAALRSGNETMFFKIQNVTVGDMIILD